MNVLQAGGLIATNLIISVKRCEQEMTFSKTLRQLHFYSKSGKIHAFKQLCNTDKMHL